MTYLTSKKRRIAIVTTGRFHVCDLARELALLGHEVKFYSLVPPWRTKKFGLPSGCNRWMLPRVAVKFSATRVARSERARERAAESFVLGFDDAVSNTIEPCDVLIGMSGMCNRLAATVRKKFGAQVWIERGSRHILSQKQILASIPGATDVSNFSVERELKDYEQADIIAVLSKHCEESFIECGVAGDKLVRNPLGVDLARFTPTASPASGPPTVIMTGTWSLRKGCNFLVDAWRQLDGVRLLHVGSVSDCPLPKDNGFEHIDKVDQSKLIDYYSKSHTFALASHEEGLATVQPQALACGLRLVCTTRTGGEDLIPMTNSPDVISVVEPGRVAAFAEALLHSLRLAKNETGIRNRLLPDAGDDLSWSSYGQRYSKAICSRFTPGL